MDRRLVAAALVAAPFLRRGKRTARTAPASSRAQRPPSAPLKLAHEEALGRLKHHSANHYAGLYNVMKGVTLAAAGLAVIRLITHGYTAERIPLLAIGMVAVILTYNGAVIGQTIVHLRTSWVDVSLPMALTVAEFVLIVASTSGKRDEPMPTYWPLALAAWQLLAALVVASVAKRLQPTLYTTTLWPAVAEYRKSQWLDAAMAAVTGLLTLVFWVVQRHELPHLDALSFVFLGFTGLSLIGAFVHHEQTRTQLERSLGQFHPAS
jgi:hypothetical protein